MTPAFAALVLLSSTIGTSTVVPQEGGGMIRPRRPALPGHASLLAMGDQATMLAPERERWAVAELRSVGDRREQAYPDGGKWDVFDLDLQVLDGWNVPKGALRAFWNEDDGYGRVPLLRTMIGSRLLIRLAPTENGRFLIVSGDDSAPDIAPTFAVGPRALLSLVLPTTATTLDPGTPEERRFRSLWRAGASLTTSAYGRPFFARYIGQTPLLETATHPEEIVRDQDGAFVDEGRKPGKDVMWLRRLGQNGSPAFQILVEAYLRGWSVQGWDDGMREATRRALKDPALASGGLFSGVIDPDVIPVRRKDPDWVPQEATIAVLLKHPSKALTIDLLKLLTRYGVFVPNRAKLLFLLNDSDETVRWMAGRTFDEWQGKPPKDADPVAWHRARAKLGKEALAAAKAAPGG